MARIKDSTQGLHLQIDFREVQNKLGSSKDLDFWRSCRKAGPEIDVIQRTYLTEQYVDEIELPPRGERWIADSAQSGFGLRVWATTNGIGKAYSVRATSPDGATIRRSVSLWSLRRNIWRGWEEREAEVTIGKCLPAARKWARDQLDQIRGKPTLRDEERSQSARSARWGRNLTLQRAAEAVLMNLNLAGRSIAYRDRLDKLFARHVPHDIQIKRVFRIKSSDIDMILKSPDLKPENLRILRPFLSRCLDICRQVKIRPHTSVLWHGYKDLPDIDDPLDEIGDNDQTAPWRTDDFHRFLGSMITEDRWQQGLCLSFYFYTHASLSQMMTARWDEFSDLAYSSRLDSNAPLMWRREWRHVDGRFNRNQLTRRAQAIFAAILDKHESLGLDSDYLFPSQYGRSAPHIRSIDHVWREGLARAGLRYISPKHMRTLFENKRFYEIWTHDNRLFTPAETDQLRPNCPKLETDL
jgi:hypothetical protein